MGERKLLMPSAQLFEINFPNEGIHMNVMQESGSCYIYAGVNVQVS